MLNEMEEFYEMKISEGLHQKVKNIMKKDMTKKEVYILIHWHCSVWESDMYKEAQLVSLKSAGFIN